MKQEILHQIAQGVTAETGEAFFWSLAEQLAITLDADHALISMIDPSAQGMLQTVAIVVDGKRAENFKFPLEGTPCAKSLAQDIYCLTVGTQQAFGGVQLLVELSVEGYVGKALYASDGQPLGTIAVFYRQPVPDTEIAATLLKIFAFRAAAEMERLAQIEALRESERHLRSIYLNSPLPYQSLDGDGCFLDVNQSWLEVFGYAPGEVLGQPFTAFMTEASANLVKQNFPGLKQEGSVRDAEFEMLRKDGSSVMVVLNGRSAYDEKGHFQRTHCILHDVTERVRLQTQNLRTGQLAAIGELAAGVAHEINNPITGVINYAQLILNHAEQDSTVAEVAARIVKEGDRIAQIVRQLLMLSRVETPDYNPVDLTHTLADTLALVGSQLHQEGIDLKVDIADELPKVFGHAQQLQQLFLNVLSNARYALRMRYPESDPQKVIHVSLGSETGSDGLKVLKVVVRDCGVGIPEELLPRIMQPFVTNKPSADGTGLGLSISNEIVKKHGGQIQVDSEMGHYTEVSICLPVMNREDGNG